MLSSGKYHLLVPREPQANIRFRRAMLERVRHDRPAQEAVREMCRRDFFFFVLCFVWQTNPRKVGLERGPFLTWEFQDHAFRELLDCIECHCNQSADVHQHDMLWEKSREMGATWMFLLVAVWLCLFHKDKHLLMVSKSEAAVDSESHNSLFWKIDFIHKYLPNWLKGPIQRKKNFIGYQTESAIVGEASTGRAGVGGRATVMFVDEFSQIREDYEILSRTSDTTGCRLFNGTHLGTGTAFYDLSRRKDMRKRVMHWTDHPDKRKGIYRYIPKGNKIEVLDKTFNYPPEYQFLRSEAPAGGPKPGIRSPWYDEQCTRKPSPRAVAMDLDIDPGGSVAEFFDPIRLREYRAEHGLNPFWEGDLDYDREAGKPNRGLIQRKGGPIKLWLNLTPEGKPPPSKYVAGSDVSTGYGATPSTLSIMDSKTGVKVLELATSQLSPEKFAPLVTALCWLFCDAVDQPAYLVWETPGPGLMFGKTVAEELGFDNIFFRESHQTLAGGKQSAIPGWNSQPATKELLLEEYRAALWFRQCVNHSAEAIEQCQHYRYAATGKGVEHPSDLGNEDPHKARLNHGDLVIADALAWMLCKRMGLMDQKPEEKIEGPAKYSLAWRRERQERLDRDAAFALD